MLTVHNQWDPAVPAFHEDSLAARVSAAGASVNLVQRRLFSYGHCAIPAATVLQSFNDLAAWVTSGDRPLD